MFQLLTSEYLAANKAQQLYILDKHLRKLTDTTTNIADFKFYLMSSAVYSSQIEGNPIDLDSYLKFHESEMNTKGKSFKEIQDLTTAYQFAAENPISYVNLLEIHALLSQNILEEAAYRGQIRDKEVGVYAEGKKIYSAANANIVAAEVEKLVSDALFLLRKSENNTLDSGAIFYYAAQIHLRVAQIHPFADGNGRTARLLEKWFLSACIGQKAWSIGSEKHYFLQKKAYYINIHLGNSYENLDYNHVLPFLLMLPKALRTKK